MLIDIHSWYSEYKHATSPDKCENLQTDYEYKIQCSLECLFQYIVYVYVSVLLFVYFCKTECISSLYDGLIFLCV